MKHLSFLLMVLAAGLLVTGQSAEARKRPVRLMTYNVGAFGKELEDSAPMIARMIVELGAETVALNELDSCNRRHNINQVQHLADELNGLSTTGKRKGKWQGRFGRAAGSACRQERSGNTSRTASITCRTALAPI